MSDYKALTDKIRRERETEEKVRRLDASDIVDWVHGLEDELERLRAERDFDRAHIESLQNKLAQASADVVVLEDEVERMQQEREEIIEQCAEIAVKVYLDVTSRQATEAIRALKEER